MKVVKALLMFCMCLCAHLLAQDDEAVMLVMRVSSFQEIGQYLDQLVTDVATGCRVFLVDCDGVLVENAKDVLVCDQAEMQEQYILAQLGRHPRFADEQEYIEWLKMEPDPNDVVLVDPFASYFCRQWFEEGSQLFCLSKRTSKVGLPSDVLSPDEFNFLKWSRLRRGRHYKVKSLSSGIVFTNSADKGEFARNLIQEVCNPRPFIIGIDDHLENLQAYQKLGCDGALFHFIKD